MAEISTPMNAEDTWLGIDPGLATVGWSILTTDSNGTVCLIDYGTIETEKTLSTPERLAELEEDLVTLMEEFEPTNAALEMPFFSRKIKAAGGVLRLELSTWFAIEKLRLSRFCCINRVGKPIWAMGERLKAKSLKS